MVAVMTPNRLSFLSSRGKLRCIFLPPVSSGGTREEEISLRDKGEVVITLPWKKEKGGR